MRRPTESMQIFKERRDQLKEMIPGAALIVAAHPEQTRNSDVDHPYRQDSNMHYLTGFDEPGSILVFRPGMNPETTLFVRHRDPEKEIWDGFRYGPEGAEREFKVDKAYPLDEFEKVTVDLLVGIERLYFRLFKNDLADQMVKNVLEKRKRAHGRTGSGLLPIFDADEVLGEMRLIKSDYEIQQLRVACDLTSDAHKAAMRFVRPGVNERQVEAVLAYEMTMRHSARYGYTPIVASGQNATTLHYNFNDDICGDGQLLLIDAGGEYNFYTSDITRTFPVNGKFTEAQAKIYEGVLHAQKVVIDAVKPGLLIQDLQKMTIDVLTDFLLDLGVFSGRKEDIISSAAFKRYYPHGVSHWLGLDVHDSGLYMKKNEPRQLEPGMCFTVEPGLYFQGSDMDAPQEFRGIGIRIEDNILVTGDGAEVLTKDCPKEIKDIEAIMAEPRVRP